MEIPALLCQTGVKESSLMPSLPTRKETLSSSKVWNIFYSLFLHEVWHYILIISIFFTLKPSLYITWSNSFFFKFKWWTFLWNYLSYIWYIFPNWIYIYYMKLHWCFPFRCPLVEGFPWSSSALQWVFQGAWWHPSNRPCWRCLPHAQHRQSRRPRSHLFLPGMIDYFMVWFFYKFKSRDGATTTINLYFSAVISRMTWCSAIITTLWKMGIQKRSRRSSQESPLIWMQLWSVP